MWEQAASAVTYLDFRAPRPGVWGKRGAVRVTVDLIVLRRQRPGESFRWTGGRGHWLSCFVRSLGSFLYAMWQKGGMGLLQNGAGRF